MSYIKKMEEVRLLQPRMALVSINNENSPYVSYSGNLKNCHLLCGSEYDENCYYGFWLYDSRDSTDCDYCQKCELCYECVDCIECYNVNFSQDLSNCTDCDFCYDCTGCNNCFGCVGLRRKQFMIDNKPYSREGYIKKLNELKDSSNREKFFEMLEQMKFSAPHLYTHILNIENCTGDYVYNSRNSLNCFDVKQLEDCHYCNNCVALKDCLDMSNSYYNSELDYEVMSEMNLYNCNFCVTCFDSQNLDHCELVYNSHDCFGCFSMKHAEYCIFNEKYPKEEYEKKIAQIKKEMFESGEYMTFPASTYPYEDSNAAMEWKIC